MNKIIKITATVGGQYISWSRENIGDMINDIPEKIQREGIYRDVVIEYEECVVNFRY